MNKVFQLGVWVARLEFISDFFPRSKYNSIFCIMGLLTIICVILSYLTSVVWLLARAVGTAVICGGSDDIDPTLRKKLVCIRSTSLSLDTVRKILPDWEVTDQLQDADFVYADANHLLEKEFFAVRAKLKSILRANNLFDKVNLHEMLAKKFPESVCKSQTARKDSRIPPDTVWILKANWGWFNKGNVIVTNQQEFDDAFKKLNIVPSEAPVPKDFRVKIVASEYIRRPMLYYGFKFHIRIWVIVLVKSDGTKKAWMVKKGVITCAGEKFIDKNYSNPLIHDTRMYMNPEHVALYPDAFTDRDDFSAITESMQHMVKGVFWAAKDNIAKYEEAENACHMFGLDVMLTEDGAPKLLEVNKLPGFRSPFTGPEVGPNNPYREPLKLLAEIAFTAMANGPVCEVFGAPCGDAVLLLF